MLTTGPTAPPHDDEALSCAIETSEQLRESVAGPKEHGGHRLSEMQRSFAREYVLTGGNATKAAVLAGYGAPEKAGFRNLVNPTILHEIKRISIVHTEALLPIAVRQLVEIMCNPELDARARVQAATALLDRGGMKPKSDGPAVQVNVQVNGQAAQAAIADVWNARQQRMSGIGSRMADTNDGAAGAVIDAAPAALAPPAVTPQGGASGQGPVPVPVSILPHSPEHLASNLGGLSPGEDE